MTTGVRRRPAPRIARTAPGLLLAAALAAAPTLAHAWKPSTHVSLAELALQDALDDGHVTLMRVDPATGAVVGELGRFRVAPEVLAALRSSPAQFRAGVIGPDGYPDLLTGQQIIHPRVALDAGGQVVGSDAWLRYLWDRAYGEPSASPEVRAFVTGYLVHAAGDSFAHTYVNHYSGGEFTLDPGQNAVRHLVLEAYIGKRAPAAPADLAVGIVGVEAFIHREMIDARPGSALETRLLRAAGGGTPTLSIPLVFSSLRNRLAREVAEYEAELATRTGVARAWLRMTRGGTIEYRRRWIDDIDRGLKAWPATSAEISAGVLYYPDHMDTDRAKAALDRYARRHLWSMAGAPDGLVAAAYVPQRLARAILPEVVRRQIEAVVEAPFEAMLKAATTMNSEEWKAHMANPELHFDRVMDRETPQDAARPVSLAEFNRDQLKIDDTGYDHPERRWELEAFAPAFNTVQLTKLSFLAPEQLREVERALGREVTQAPPPNVMLGWVGSLDASSQWRSEGAKPGAWFAAPPAFGQIFRPHFGAP